MTGRPNDPLSTQELSASVRRDRSRVLIITSFALSAVLGAVAFAFVSNRDDRAIQPQPTAQPAQKTVEAPAEPPAPVMPEPETPKVTIPRRPISRPPPAPEPEERVARPIAPEALRRVIAEREKDVSSCHLIASSQGKTPPRVDLALTIEPNGHVSKARVEPSRPARLASCLAVKTKSWRFPADPNRAPQEVKVPVVLVSARG